MASLCSAALLRIPILSQSSFTPNTSDCGRVVYLRSNKKSRRSCNAMCASMKPKQVWIRTENKDVMTAAVESGWNTFLFPSECKELADNWSLIARINPLFIEMGSILDMESKVAAKMAIVKNPDDLQSELENEEAQNVVVDLQDWQIIPAENIVAALQHSQKTVFAISKTPSEAQVFFEVLEQGLDRVVLEVDDAKAIFELKSYLDKRNEANSLLSLTKATVTGVHVAGMGERACVDLCSLMRPGEGLLVGSFARGLFLVHSECLESNYIASRPFRVNAGPVHAYVAVPGGKTSYLSELRAGKEVLVVDNKGHQRTAIVGRVKIETRPLILVEAKIDMDDQTTYSIFLQNAETVPLICPTEEDGQRSTTLPVTSLKIGNQVLLRLQGGARHTGLEIQEFIVEK